MSCIFPARGSFINSTTGFGKRRDKWTWVMKAIGLPEAMFGTSDHHKHCIRCAAINLFSIKAAVRKLEPVVDERVDASKGTRMCVGKNLAYAELYLTLIAVFRSYGSKELKREQGDKYLELFERTAEDVRLTKDVFIPVTPDSYKGVLIVVKK
jgi:hypothetical protein